MKEKAASLQKGTADMKTKLSQATRANAQLKERLVIAREKNGNLEGKILQSPERIKGEQEWMQQQLEVLEESCMRRRARLAEMQYKETQMKAWNQQTKEMERLMKVVEAKINKEE